MLSDAGAFGDHSRGVLFPRVRESISLCRTPAGRSTPEPSTRQRPPPVVPRARRLGQVDPRSDRRSPARASASGSTPANSARRRGPHRRPRADTARGDRARHVGSCGSTSASTSPRRRSPRATASPRRRARSGASAGRGGRDRRDDRPVRSRLGSVGHRHLRTAVRRHMAPPVRQRHDHDLLAQILATDLATTADRLVSATPRHRQHRYDTQGASRRPGSPSPERLLHAASLALRRPPARDCRRPSREHQAPSAERGAGRCAGADRLRPTSRYGAERDAQRRRRHRRRQQAPGGADRRVQRARGQVAVDVRTGTMRATAVGQPPTPAT